MKQLIVLSALILCGCRVTDEQKNDGKIEVTVTKKTAPTVISKDAEQQLIDNWYKATVIAEKLENQLHEQHIYCSLSYDGDADCSRVGSLDVSDKLRNRSKL